MKIIHHIGVITKCIKESLPLTTDYKNHYPRWSISPTKENIDDADLSKEFKFQPNGIKMCKEKIKMRTSVKNLSAKLLTNVKRKSMINNLSTSLTSMSHNSLN